MADNWQLKAILSAVDNLSPVLKQVSGTAKSARKYLLDVGSATSKLGGHLGLPLAALSGVLGGFSIMAVKKAVVGFTEMGEAVYKSSLRTGMSVEQIQRMKYVAEQAGVSIESLEGGIGKLNRNIGDATSGKNKDLAALFRKLGVSARDANGQLKSGMDILPQLSDAFVRNKNPVVQARMGMALFGKSWQEMVPLLMEGSDGITNSLQRFSRIKGVLSLDDIKGAKDLGDEFKNLELVMKGFQGTIARELVPIIKPLVVGLTDWWVANKKLVSVEVGKMAKDLGEWLKSIDFAEVAKGAKEFVGAIRDMVQWVGGAKNALLALVIVMNLQTIAAFVGLIGAVGRLAFGLSGLVLSALAPVAPLQTLSASMAGANARAALLVGTVGKLGAAAAVAAAAFVGWEIGSWLNDHAINPAIQKMTGDDNQTLGGWIYDKLHPAEMPPAGRPAVVTQPEQFGRRPSLLLPQQTQQVGGKFTFDFQNAPPGMRLTGQETKGKTDVDMNMGWRSDALGMP